MMYVALIMLLKVSPLTRLVREIQHLAVYEILIMVDFSLLLRCGVNLQYVSFKTWSYVRYEIILP
jgi:hypothetical protein